MSKVHREHIILNFLPIVSGGGLQNALSFIKVLADDRNWKDCCVGVGTF